MLMLTPRRSIILGMCVLTSACGRYPQKCSPGACSVNQWDTERIGGGRRILIRVPPRLEKDYVNDSASYRWRAPDNTQLNLQIFAGSGEPLFTSFPLPEERPEYERSDASINRMKATIVTYNKIDHVGDTGILGPFHVFAQIELDTHTRLLIYGMATERQGHNELLASIRSIRVPGP